MPGLESSPPNPNSPQTVYVPVPMQKPPGLLSRLFSLVQWLAFLFFAVVMLAAIFMPDSIGVDSENRVEERYYSLNSTGAHKVAIIEVEGMITDAEPLRKQCDKAAKDSTVKAIVLRVDSPGGLVSASDQMYHYLRELVTEKEIPLVVSMGGLAASGGYYVSMACGDRPDVIYAEPTTWTGSIGVIIPHYNIAGLMERFDVEEDSIKSGPLKAMGGMTKKMTPEERAVFEQLVQESFERFKQIVENGRPKLKKDPAIMAKATTGQVFTTEQALKLGLVDKQGFLEDAIDRALELAGLDRGNTKVVKYKKPKTLVDSLVGVTAPKRPAIDVSALLDLATPRAFYLFAWPPTNE